MPKALAVVMIKKKNLSEVSDQLQKRKPRATLQSAQTSVTFAVPTKYEWHLLKSGKLSDCYMNVMLHKHRTGTMMLAIRPTTNEPIAAWRDQNQVICPVKSSYAPISRFKDIAFNKLGARIVYSNTIESLLPLPDNVELRPYDDEICMLTAIHQLLGYKNTQHKNSKRDKRSLAELQSLDPNISQHDYEKIYK